MIAGILDVLILSTPVGPLGSGLGGGVEHTLRNLARALSRRGHRISIVAPAGSQLEQSVITQVDGALQRPAQRSNRSDATEMPAGAVVAAMWERAWQLQDEHSLILNVAYDWLPFYLTPFFRTPIVHLVSMGSLSDAMDEAIGRVVDRYPGRVAVYTRSQARTFPFGDRCVPVGTGMDLDEFPAVAPPADCLGWLGRIAPEKGLEDAISAASLCGMPLRVWGLVDDTNYWAALESSAIDYRGFIHPPELYREMAQCRAVLVTPKWIEAFGNVAMESLACGVPVVAYRCGGLSEIVEEGTTGWMVEPGDVAGLATAVSRLDRIDRSRCRERAAQRFSLEAMAARYEAWFEGVLATSR